LTDYFKVSEFDEMNETQLHISSSRWIKETSIGNSIMVTVCRTVLGPGTARARASLSDSIEFQETKCIGLRTLPPFVLYLVFAMRRERKAVKYYQLLGDQGDSDSPLNYDRWLQNGLGIAGNELSAGQMNNFGRTNSRLCLPKEIWHRKNGKEVVECY
jgi:hypothetical protein